MMKKLQTKADDSFLGRKTMPEVKSEIEKLRAQIVTLSRDLADSVRDYLDLRDRCNKICSENEMLKEQLEQFRNEQENKND